ncbi:hypothetical protein F5X68DRAFT_196370 [Plectosphaerella plurivora]|uniref:RRM domain-containing protein n=1 Tax=Plectosphaerella plurivora TaxID=936078 RepID=A0A9P8VN25_9PEZI|nr:hypothetical protein F5X68DRAFT_196370 [Plectosphaerella plurivora]
MQPLLSLRTTTAPLRTNNAKNTTNTMATEKPTKDSVQKDVGVTSPKKRKADLEELEVDVTAPEPPSKRAKRALKKGKPLPPKPDSDDDRPGKSSRPKKQPTDNTDDLNDDAPDDKDKAKAAPVRSEHAVWIGNLPFTATINELRGWLVDKSGGAVSEESITRVHLPTQKLPGKKDKANKGFAYVDFADLSSKLAAITLSDEWLGIRRLLIKDHTSFEGRPKKEERAAAAAAAAVVDDTPASRKIFVGNLGFQTTEDDVRNNFEKCGEIDWVKTATFEDSGKCKGYGWVKFREAESAAWAVKGFVKLKEEIETEDDFVAPAKKEEEEEEASSSSSSGSDSDSDSDAEKKEKKPKKVTKKAAPAQPEKRFKTRKWWVNRIAGRTLKIELAEDDQTRYKKRYKGGPKKQAPGASQDAETGEEAFQRRRNGGAPRPAAKEAEATPAAPKPAKELKTQDDLMVARLTGAAAKSTGTKIKF